MSELKKVELLERSILDLGSEIFHLKNELHALRGSNEEFLKLIEGLKVLLEDKGVIAAIDFENEIDINALADQSTDHYSEVEAFQSIDPKKNTH